MQWLLLTAAGCLMLSPPQIKAHPWSKVFSKRMPADAVDLVRSLLFLLFDCTCCTQRVALSARQLRQNCVYHWFLIPAPAAFPPHPAARLQVSKLLVYSPTQRSTALEAMRHSFFDELRDPACRLPNGAARRPADYYYRPGPYPVGK